MQNNGIYLITANFSKIYEIISAKFKNVAVFEPIGGFVRTEDAAEAFENGAEKELIKSIISEFNKLKKKHDLVVVRAFEAFSNLGKFELNLLLARHLNTSVFSERNLKALNLNSNLVISSNLDEVLNAKQEIMTPFRFENLLIETAKKDKKTVVLPESDDERILRASELLIQTKAVNLTLLGDEDVVKKRAEELGINLSGVKFINLEKNVFQESFAKELFELRKHKGMSQEQARELILDRTYFGTMMVHAGLADAMVSGASTNTSDTVRPAFQIIKTTPDDPLVSSSFLMCMGEEILIYADCAVIPNPDAKALAHIAIASAKTALEFGISPRIALLSYSTGSSGSGVDVELVKEAKKIINELDPNLPVEAPIQYDAAIDAGVAKKKLPNSEVAGRANVFVFPNLNSGNIGYKIAQRSGHCIAIGPILQGLKKPVNDLSRGCLVDDIINTVLITAIQAGGK